MIHCTKSNLNFQQIFINESDLIDSVSLNKIQKFPMFNSKKM
jgi:hypothetical protein